MVGWRDLLSRNQASLADPSSPAPIASRRPYSWVGEVLEAADQGYGNYNGLELQLRGNFRLQSLRGKIQLHRAPQSRGLLIDFAQHLVGKGGHAYTFFG